MKIKFTLILTIALFAGKINAQESASKILDTAFEQANLENKNVFVMFHASWCGWCKKMEKQMKMDATKAFFDDNYVIAFLDVNESPNNKSMENPGGQEVLKKYNGEKAGLPFWIIVDKDRNLITNSFNVKGENLGCPATKEEVESFLIKLKKSSSLTKNDLAVIKEIFIEK